LIFARTLLTTAALLAAWPTAAHAITVVTRAEAFSAAIMEVFAQSFAAATDIPVHIEVWEGGLDVLRARGKSGETNWDLVQVDPDELATGCAEGLFEKLDWAAVGGKDHYQAQAVSDCGLGAVMTNAVLAWDRDKFPATPTWADFWDVAKYPGKRGLGKSPRGALEIALLADGVAPGDVYRTLASADGLDRAFRKLDQLRPYIVWWQTDAEAARILGSGDVLMTSGASNAIATAARVEHRNFGIQWAGSLFELQSWAIPRGSPNVRQAQQFLYYQGTPAIAGRLPRVSGDAAFAKGANEGLSPELLAISPTLSANLNTGLRIDSAFWRENLPKLKPRFDAWLSGK